MKIVIIRHAEPDYSIDSLTETGWKEANLLADRVARMRVRDFYVSPLGRAQDTARPTLERMGRTAETLPWLAEFRGRIMSPKSGEMTIPWDLMPQYWTQVPEFYDQTKWTENALMQTGNVAEIYKETAEGVDALLARYGMIRDGRIYRCEQNNEDTIVIICHLALGMAMISHITGISPVLLWHGMFMPTSSVTTLISEERKKGEVWWRCMQMGDTSHLYVADQPVSYSGLYRETYERYDRMSK